MVSSEVISGVTSVVTLPFWWRRQVTLCLDCVQVLLASHKAWLKLQRCKDRFEPLLRLDALKSCSSKPAAVLAAPAPRTAPTVRDASAPAAGSGVLQKRRCAENVRIPVDTKEVL